MNFTVSASQHNASSSSTVFLQGRHTSRANEGSNARMKASSVLSLLVAFCAYFAILLPTTGAFQSVGHQQFHAIGPLPFLVTCRRRCRRSQPGKLPLLLQTTAIRPPTQCWLNIINNNSHKSTRSSSLSLEMVFDALPRQCLGARAKLSLDNNQRQRLRRSAATLLESSISSSPPPPMDNNQNDIETSTNSSESSASPKTSWLARIRLRGPNDGLTFRQRLGKMGLATVLSYGWVSNMSYCVSVSVAWYIFNKQTGLSPLAPGQWKRFLAVYAGFWVFNNLVRPIRLAVSIGVAPQFDAVVSSLQSRLRVSRAAAVAVTVVLANVLCTISFMALGIFVASLLAGVPVFPPK